MRAFQVAAILALAACGGKVTEGVGGAGIGTGGGRDSGSELGAADSGSISSNDSGLGYGSGSGSGSGSQVGTGSVDGGSSQADAGKAEAAFQCSLPTSGNVCTFCGNEWYCPTPRMPWPSCPPAPQDPPQAAEGVSCTVDCTECLSDGTVWSWDCVGGKLENGTNFGFSCSP
jgi:hypothetical protein